MTLLEAVNKVLRRVNVLTGDAGELASLTDSPRQVFIDTAVQAWNEAVIELYAVSATPIPNELAESTIVLAENDRDYALDAALVQLHFPLINEADNRVIEEYPGGYLQMVADQALTTQTGIPYYAAIRPTDGELFIDSSPTASEVGTTYKYRYDKELLLTTAASTFPFKNTVVDALVPGVAEIWRRNRNKTFDPNAIRKSMGTASKYMTQLQQRGSWLPDRHGINKTDPFS